LAVRFFKRLFACLAILVVVTVAVGAIVGRSSMADWRTASRASVGIAPDPAEHREAIAQVYAARALSWRGTFGVHTWIATKPTNASTYTVYEVMGWRVRHGGDALAISNRPADGRWFGNAPELLADIRGEGVDALIAKIDTTARAYPYRDSYQVWPGPNSNTFTAFVARAIPELKLDLPPTAIGKDYIPGGGLVAATPSGTGYQVSFFGLAGLLASREEGFEINLLGLTFGMDFKEPALKLPIAGRIGSPSHTSPY
jgi:Na+-transporting methylmalonyl-CoA/oxaloacetate decarboxylase gamma subunit